MRFIRRVQLDPGIDRRLASCEHRIIGRVVVHPGKILLGSLERLRRSLPLGLQLVVFELRMAEPRELVRHCVPRGPPTQLNPTNDVVSNQRPVETVNK